VLGPPLPRAIRGSGRTLANRKKGHLGRGRGMWVSGGGRTWKPPRAYEPHKGGTGTVLRGAGGYARKGPRTHGGRRRREERSYQPSGSH